jgi:UDP-glucose 4-epimerase
MKVLVTGGAGYIGSVAASQLLEAGHEVIVYDNLSTGNIQAVPQAATLIVGDIGDAASLKDVFERYPIDAVMHFAALIEAGESMKTPEDFFRVNVAYTLTLLETMLRYGVQRMVFSSTAALYGDPERTPIAEGDRILPTNAYGETKLMVERMLDWMNRIHGLRYACLRYFNAAGAAGELGPDHHPESHLIPLILRVPLGKTKSVQIYGTDYDTSDGTCVRDYIHVSDLASAHVLALDRLETQSVLTYNLGNGRGFTVREVIEAARRITGHPIPAVEMPRRAGDPAVLIASSEKIKTDLGWVPKYADLETILASEWEWFQQHPGGYSAVESTETAAA